MAPPPKLEQGLKHYEDDLEALKDARRTLVEIDTANTAYQNKATLAAVSR